MAPRSDIEYALQTGTRPRFYRNKWPREEIQQQLCIAEHYTTTHMDIHDAAIKGVFDDCIAISTILNTEKIDASQIMADGRIRPRLRGSSFQDILISVLYRLLDAYPFDAKPPSRPVDAACQAGLICLMTTMMIRGSPLHHQYYQKLRERLFEALSALKDGYPEFRFWLCFVGGASVFDTEADWKWLGPLINKLANKLGLAALRDARLVLMKFPWVRYFHDEASGSVFWNALGTWQTVKPEKQNFLYWSNSLNRLKPYLTKDSPD